MAYSQYNRFSDMHYIADAVADLNLIPHPRMGDTCLVIENGMKYICNSKAKWIAQTQVEAPEILKKYYTKEEIDKKIPHFISLTDNEILALTIKQ